MAIRRSVGDALFRNSVELLAFVTVHDMAAQPGLIQYPYREHIAGCAMQYAIGSGSENQSQAVPAMAAHDDQIGLDLFGQIVDLGFGSAYQQVLRRFIDIQALC